MQTDGLWWFLLLFGCSLSVTSITPEKKIALRVESAGVSLHGLCMAANQPRLLRKPVTCPTDKAEDVTRAAICVGLLLNPINVRHAWACCFWEMVIINRNAFNVKYVKIHSSTYSLPLRPSPHFAPSICHLHSQLPLLTAFHPWATLFFLMLPWNGVFFLLIASLHGQPVLCFHPCIRI